MTSPLEKKYLFYFHLLWTQKSTVWQSRWNLKTEKLTKVNFSRCEKFKISSETKFAKNCTEEKKHPLGIIYLISTSFVIQLLDHIYIVLMKGFRFQKRFFWFSAAKYFDYFLFYGWKLKRLDFIQSTEKIIDMSVS